MKRFLKICAVAFALLLICTFSSFAAENTSDNTTWTLDADGTLTVSCEGVCNGVPLTEEQWKTVKTIVFTEGVTEIGDEAFGAYWNKAPMMQYTSVTLPEGLQKIGAYAFMSVKTLTEVHLPDSLTELGYGAFAESGITSLTIPKGITSLTKAEFCSNPLTSVTFHENFTELGEFALSGTALETVELPNSLQKIGSRAFAHCGKLRSVTIPEGVTEIDAYAFWNCRSLAEMVLPSTLTSIHGTFVWNSSPDLHITLQAGSTAFVIVEDVLYSADMTTLLRYPPYKTETSFTVPQSVTQIAHMAFYGCVNLTEILLPEGLRSIGGMAFSGCDNLKTVTIPESVEAFGEVASHGGVPDYFGIGCGVVNAFYKSGLEEVIILSRIADATEWYQGQAWLPENITLYCYEYSATDLGDKDARNFYGVANTDAYTIRYLEEDHEHAWTEEILREATCVEMGRKHLICAVCNMGYYEDIPLTDHSLEDRTISATCYRAGQRCKVCTACAYYEVLEEFPQTAHTFGELKVITPATCTEDGAGERMCRVCLCKQSETIPATGHSYGEWTQTVAPTLQAVGEEQCVCTACGDVQTREVPKLALSEVAVPYVLAADAVLVLALVILVLKKKKK